MRSAAAPPPPADAAPSRPAPSGAAWATLACGVACGLAAGQFAAGRAVRADLYTLKRDVAGLRQSADALTAAGGRSGEVASLLGNLRAQRSAVGEAEETWREAEAALARAARLRERATAALTDAERTATHAATVAAAVSDALEVARRARDAAEGRDPAAAELPPPVPPGTAAAARRPLIARKPARRRD